MSAAHPVDAREAFQRALRARVDAHFAGRSRAGGARGARKAALAIALLLASYAGLLASTSAASASAFAALHWLALVMTGFCVAHEGAHGSLTGRPRADRAASFAFDLLGGSQLVWRRKHNVLHHGHTNVAGRDADLDTLGVMRLAPDQPWRPWHRLQHVYAVPLYATLTAFWWIADVVRFARGRVASEPLRAAPGEAVLFVAAKGAYLGVALGLPSLLHPFSHVLAVFVAVQLAFGLAMSFVFQLGHNFAGAAHREELPRGAEWAAHQVEASADFCPDSRLFAVFLGGLHCQIEHHLFPRVSHVHLSEVQRIVRATCAEFGVAYTCHATLGAALASHFRQLRALGRRPAGALVPPLVERVA